MPQKYTSRKIITNNVHVTGFKPLPSPDDVRSRFPSGSDVIQTVNQARQDIRDSLTGKDKRLLVVTGPCSIHDIESAMDYAQRLAKLREKVCRQITVIMRVYFEKPRTTVGWKGLINDPNLDSSHDIAKGIRIARKLLLDINSLGVACATEFLDPIIPQYTSDLISWAAVGARTTESQLHREMASGLSMPVGFKNATDGLLDPAVNAIISSRQPHTFVGIDKNGKSCIVRTTGNPDVHLVLRGGGGKPNYRPQNIQHAKEMLKIVNNRPLLIDCSHDNSGKDYRKQPKVFMSVLNQYAKGENALLGMMLESNLNEGKQDYSDNMQYGVSITDSCINWETTEELILRASDKIAGMVS